MVGLKKSVTGSSPISKLIPFTAFFDIPTHSPEAKESFHLFDKGSAVKSPTDYMSNLILLPVSILIFSLSSS